jgi:hypothetical protein
MLISQPDDDLRRDPHLCYPLSDEEIRQGVIDYEADFDAADEALAGLDFETAEGCDDPRLQRARDICKVCVNLSGCIGDAIRLTEYKKPRTIHVSVNGLPTFLGGLIVYEGNGVRHMKDITSPEEALPKDDGEVEAEPASDGRDVVELFIVEPCSDEPSEDVQVPAAAAHSEEKAVTKRQEQNGTLSRRDKHNLKWMTELQDGPLKKLEFSRLDSTTTCFLSILCRAPGKEFTLDLLREEYERITGETLSKAEVVDTITRIVRATADQALLAARLGFRTQSGNRGEKIPVIRWKQKYYRMADAV